MKANTESIGEGGDPAPLVRTWSVAAEQVTCVSPFEGNERKFSDRGCQTY